MSLWTCNLGRKGGVALVETINTAAGTMFTFKRATLTAVSFYVDFIILKTSWGGGGVRCWHSYGAGAKSTYSRIPGHGFKSCCLREGRCDWANHFTLYASDLAW